MSYTPFRLIDDRQAVLFGDYDAYLDYQDSVGVLTIYYTPAVELAPIKLERFVWTSCESEAEAIRLATKQLYKWLLNNI